MFILSRIVFFLIRPSTLLIVLLAVGLALLVSGRARRFGRALALGAFAAILAIGYLPLGSAALLVLENRFPTRDVATVPADRYQGIIILGGFETPDVTAARGVLALNESAERLTAGVQLAKRLANADVIFTGGIAELWGNTPSAAKPIGAYLQDVGIASNRIKLESRARNTHENARLTYDLVRPKSGDRYVLVTSAYHMPRAMGVFRAAGFAVDAWPTDYRVPDAAALVTLNDSLPAGLSRFDVAFREWLGLVSYFGLGRTSTLLPSP